MYIRSRQKVDYYFPAGSDGDWELLLMGMRVLGGGNDKNVLESVIGYSCINVNILKSIVLTL